MLAADKF